MMYFFPVQGKVSMNNFGNVDLYIPSMLLGEVVHVPCMPLSFQREETCESLTLSQSTASQSSLVNLSLLSHK